MSIVCFKQIADLVEADLRAHPVWEFATSDEEEGDETYVRPTPTGCVPAVTDDRVFHVACDICTAKGRLLLGFMSLCNMELHFPDPSVVGPSPSEFSLEYPPRRREQAAFEQFMGAPFQERRRLELVRSQFSYGTLF